MHGLVRARMQVSLRQSWQDSNELWDDASCGDLPGPGEAAAAPDCSEMWLIMEYCSCGTLLVLALPNAALFRPLWQLTGSTTLPACTRKSVHAGMTRSATCALHVRQAANYCASEALKHACAVLSRAQSRRGYSGLCQMTAPAGLRCCQSWRWHPMSRTAWHSCTRAPSSTATSLLVRLHAQPLLLHRHAA